MDPIIEHYRHCATRGLIDPDVAELLIATHLEGRRSATSRGRTLADVARPKAVKHPGLFESARKTG